jgi:hypothetical protein
MCLSRLNKNQRPDFHVLGSEFVAQHVYQQETNGSTWYSFDRSDIKPDSEGWEVFGDPRLLEPQSRSQRLDSEMVNPRQVKYPPMIRHKPIRLGMICSEWERIGGTVSIDHTVGTQGIHDNS